MDEFELKRIIYDYIKEICHFSQMQVFATSSYQKNYFQFQIDEATNGLINFIQQSLCQPEPQTLHSINQQVPKEPELQQMEQNSSLQDDQQEVCQKAEPVKDLKLTKEQLALYDGSEGKDAYVAVNGIIYDMTDNIRWAGGTHFGLYAGKDLSGAFNSCHNGVTEILAKLPRVGTLVS
jgi:predicted heme/steroid binding protein